MPDKNRELKIILETLKETGDFGIFLGELVQPGDILLLSGNLGAGKTTLTQFIAQGLKVPAAYYVTSPSYNLLHEYPGRIPLYHLDCYRLNDEDDVAEAGLLDYLETNGVCVVEWPDRLGSFIPASRLEINLVSEISGTRSVTLISSGQSWDLRLIQIQEMFNIQSL